MSSWRSEMLTRVSLIESLDLGGDFVAFRAFDVSALCPLLESEAMKML